MWVFNENEDMVYLLIQKEKQIVSVPRSDGNEEKPGAMTLKLTRGGVETSFSELLDFGSNALNYIFELEGTEGLVVGEYDYCLINAEGEEISVGVATAGDYIRDVNEIPGNRKIVEYGG